MEDAENLFKSYGCTHFHLHREVPDLHEKYVELDISKEQEKKWTRESFYDLIDSLKATTTDPENLWWLHSRATTLAEYLKENEVLEAIDQISFELLKRLPNSDAIMCAESILDSRDISQKCSVIFISESLGMPELAASLVNRAECFIEHYKNTDESRASKALERLEKTKSMLKNAAPNKLLQQIKKSFAFFTR